MKQLVLLSILSLLGMGMSATSFAMRHAQAAPVVHVERANPDWVLVTYPGPPPHFVKVRKTAIAAFWDDGKGHRYILLPLGAQEVLEPLNYLETMLDAGF